MESILTAFPKILDQLEINPDAREAFVFAAWPRAVGEGLSEHTMPVALNGTRLRVAVANLMWQRHLETMAAEILAKVNASLGRSSPVSFIEFFIDEKIAATNRRELKSEAPADQINMSRLDPDITAAAAVIENEELRKAFLLAAESCLERNEHLQKTA